MPIKVEKFSIQACCGSKAIVFKTDQPVTQEVLAKLVAVGFKEAEHFTKAGILYADNEALIISGPFGSDRLQVKCKVKDCDQKLNDFEELLLKLE
jgi:hypothetical protein